MDRARVEEIDNIISNLHVELAPDPRTQGPGYIARKIKEALDGSEEANKYFTEVGKAFVRQKERVSLLELEIEEGTRAHLLSRAIQDLEGISMEEKKARALMNLEKGHRDEVIAEYRSRGQTPPARIPTLKQDLHEAKSMEEILRDLLARIKEKISSLKRTDSGVRLQQRAMENELQLYGAAPTRQVIDTRRRQATAVPSRNGHDRNPDLATDPTWENLMPPSEEPSNGETHD